MKMGKKYGGTSLSLPRIIFMLLMFVAIPLQMWADDYYQGVKLTKPSKYGDVYLIKNRSELLYWAVNDQNKNIRLMADINVQGDKQLLQADGRTLAMNEKDIVVWPCVYYRSTKMTIDGNNHTISGIYQKNGYGVNKGLGSYKEYDYVGFISWTMTNTIITKLNIADSYLEGKYAGGFIGQKSKSSSMSLSEYKNCSFRGFVLGIRYAGGFVGWYRTDGQDASFYRCINYGTIESGIYRDEDNDAGAGGLIGYLDIARANIAKSSTSFNRCVNYGDITCFSSDGYAGGLIGKIWENNNGKREWRFCFNFGNTKTFDKWGRSWAGKGLIGFYENVNGKSKPQIWGCGSADTKPTGALVGDISWNYDNSNAYLPITFVGSKTVGTNRMYSSYDANETWAAWMNNHWIGTTVATIAVLLTVVTCGVSLFLNGITVGSYAAGSYLFLKAGWSTGAVLKALTGGGFIIAASIKGVIGSMLLTAAMAIPGTAIPTSAAYYIRSLFKSNPTVAANTQYEYNYNDLKRGYFAYEANQMMLADSIGGEVNEDKSILFKQHIDLKAPTLNDEIPSILTDTYKDKDMLYSGYRGCSHKLLLCNDMYLLDEPLSHQFDSNGECTLCHLKLEPLGEVYKTEDEKTVDYYTIENPSQLLYLASAFNGDNETAYEKYKNATFKLTADIDFTEDMYWAPIGSCRKIDGRKNWHYFEGKFDGQGHTISGLKTDNDVNFAGLFGYVVSHSTDKATEITNVNLSNCLFCGNYAGTIAGYLDNKSGNLLVDKVSADHTNIVATSGKNAENYSGGGLFGGITRAGIKQKTFMHIRYCYSNATILSKTQGTNPQEELGTYVGRYEETKYSDASSNSPTFEHCYYGGESPFTPKAIGTFASKKEYAVFSDCYSIGDEDKEEGNYTPHYIDTNYMTSGKLAYDLMFNSKVTENGVTTYYFTQKEIYPVLTETQQTNLCRVKMENSFGEELADTIIDVNATQLELPINYAGRTINEAILQGWDNEQYAGTPTYEGQLNDFSELYKNPERHYKLLLNPNVVSPFANIFNEDQWKGVGIWEGYNRTNILENLFLRGSYEWALKYAPQLIDGKGNMVTSALPLIKLPIGGSLKARRAVLSKSRAKETAGNENGNITLQNMRLKVDTLTNNVLNESGNKLYLENIILTPLTAKSRKVTLDWNTETQQENAKGYDFKNVACQQQDSTSVAFYQDGASLETTTFSEENKNNTYEDILGYLLSHDGMFDAFGLRLSGKNEKVAGKLGFATEADKHVYRATLYNQSTGLSEGEALMNIDGEVIYDVKGNKLGAMHEGLPDGTFAVLPTTKEALGDDFIHLGTNVITQDGKAACIRLEEGKTDGFAYPSCFNDDKKLIINALRAEYVRQVHRDGLHESIYLPFMFNSIEVDEKDFGENDKLDISFLGFSDEDGLTKNGKSLSLTSLRSYYAHKYNDTYDPSQDEADSLLFFKLGFYAGVPYMITLDCEEHADQMSPITFVGMNGEYGIGFLRKEFAIDPADKCAPLYGLFHTKTAGEVANGMKVYGLDVFTDEDTGKLYDKFVRAKDTDRLDAFRCFIATNSSLVGDDISILVDDGTATGIKDIQASELKKKGIIFDLSGRRVVKKKPRNIYIQNGKKIVNF